MLTYWVIDAGPPRTQSRENLARVTRHPSGLVVQINASTLGYGSQHECDTLIDDKDHMKFHTNRLSVLETILSSQPAGKVKRANASTIHGYKPLLRTLMETAWGLSEMSQDPS